MKPHPTVSTPLFLCILFSASRVVIPCSKDIDVSGTVSVFKAISNDLYEKNLSARTAPETQVLLGKLATQFELDQTQAIALDTFFVCDQVFPLILTHKQGNNLGAPGHGNWDLKNLTGEIRGRWPLGIRLEDNFNRLANSSSSVNLRMI